MATLTSASTFTEVQDAYKDSSAYRINNSLSMALEFEQACRILLLMIPKMSRLGGRHQVETDPKMLREEIADARQFIAQRPDSAAVRAFSVEEFRE